MIKNKMYDEGFLRRYSNAGLLVHEDDLFPTNKYSDDLLYEGVEGGRRVATAFYLLMKEGEKVYPKLKMIAKLANSIFTLSFNNDTSITIRVTTF